MSVPQQQHLKSTDQEPRHQYDLPAGGREHHQCWRTSLRGQGVHRGV